MYLVGAIDKLYGQCAGNFSPQSISSEACESTPTTFQVNSSGQSLKHIVWVYGDGVVDSSSAVTATTHSYASAGTYNFLTIRVGTNGCRDTLSSSIIVHTLPTADFSFSPDNQCANTEITFSNNSSGIDGFSSEWNFGDGKSSNNTNPKHRYRPKGNGTSTYNPQLVITDSRGCKDTSTAIINVGQEPDNSITQSNGSGFKVCNRSIDELQLANISSTKATNISYSINWGDGSPEYNDTDFSNPQSHVYTQKGFFNLVYEVLGQNGCVTVDSIDVFIGSTPGGGLESPPNTEGCAPVTFDFNVTGADANPPGTSYTITINDGTQDSTFETIPPVFSHTFLKSSCGEVGDEFIITLIVSNPCLTKEFTADAIYISRKPQAKIAQSKPSPVCENNVIRFIDISEKGLDFDGTCTNNLTARKWEIIPASGWSSTSFLGAPSSNPYVSDTWGDSIINVSFTNSGNYTLRLIEESGCGSDTSETIICVRPQPQANFTLNQDTACAPFDLQATNTSTDTNVCDTATYLWTFTKLNTLCAGDSSSNFHFQDGSSNTSRNTSAYLNNSGLYRVNLQVRSVCATSTFQQNVFVKDKPNVSFNLPSSVCFPDSVSALGINPVPCGGSISSFEWSVHSGGARSPNTLNPGKLGFNNTGLNRVKLRATNECGEDSVTRNLNVKAPPIADAGPDLTVCPGSTSDSVGVQGVQGVSYGWKFISNPNPVQSLGNANVPRTQYNGVNNGSTGIMRNLVLTASQNGCSANDTVEVTTLPQPLAPSLASSSICSGESISLVANGTTTATYRWFQTATSTVVLGTGNSFTTPVLTASTSYFVETTDFGCTKLERSQVTVTVKPNPLANAGQDLLVCLSADSLQLNGSANLAGVGTWLGDKISSQGKMAIDVVGTYKLAFNYEANNGCKGSDTVLITVQDEPQVKVLTLDTGICHHSPSFTIRTDVAGGTFSSPTSGVLSDQGVFTPNQIGIHKVYYSIGTGTCQANDSIEIEVFALPSVEAGQNEAVCKDVGQFTLSTFSPVGGTWTGSGAINSGSGDFHTDSTMSTNNLLTYTVIDSNGCANSDTKRVTVNVLPDVTAQEDTELCNNPIAESISATPAGGVWIGNNMSGSQYTPNGIGKDTLVYIFTNSNGCTNSDSTIIEVVKAPVVNVGNDTSVCRQSGNLTLIGTPASGTWKGSASVNSSGVFIPNTVGVHSLVYSVGMGTCLATDTIEVMVMALPMVNAGTDIEVCEDTTQFSLQGFSPSGGVWSGSGIVNFGNGDFDVDSTTNATNILIYTFTDGNGCVASDNKSVTINLLPEVIAQADEVLCDNPVPETLTATPLGGTWLGNNVSGTQYTPNGIGKDTLMYTFIDSKGCRNTDTTVIEVIDAPVANAGNDTSVCRNSGSLMVVGTPISGTWKGSTSVTSSGVFTPNAEGTHTLVYSVGSGTCFATDTVNIIVNALPVVSAGDDIEICEDTALFALQGYSPVGGVWSGTGTINGGNGDFNPDSTSNTSNTLTYTYQDANGCIVSDSRRVIINSLPTVLAQDDETLCNNPISENLSATPPGGTWLGNNLSGNQYTPNGVGKDTVIYFFTNTKGCKNQDTVVLDVIPSPSADAGSDTAICIYSDTLILVATPSGGSWSGSLVTGEGRFTTDSAGTFQLTYSVGGGSCNATDVVEVTVNTLPILQLEDTLFDCVNVDTLTLAHTNHSPVGGKWGGNFISNGDSGIFHPNQAESGVHSYLYSYTDANGCTDSLESFIRVHDLTSVFAGNDTLFCKTDFPGQLSGLPSGGLWSGSVVQPDGSYPANVIGVDSLVIYNFVDDHQCYNSDTLEVVVIDPDSVFAGPDTVSCVGDTPFRLKASPANGYWQGNFITSANGLFNPTTPGIHEVTYHIGYGNCMNIDTVSVIVQELPEVDAGVDEQICANGDPVQTNSHSPLGGYWTGLGIADTATGIFDPATTGAGSFQHTYTYQNPSTGCLNQDSRIFQVVSPQVINAGNDITLCNVPVTHVMEGSPIGGDWAGNGITSTGEFTPSVNGVFDIIYSLSDSNGCYTSDTVSITVTDPPLVSAGLDTSLCQADTSVILKGSPLGGSWSGVGISPDGRVELNNVQSIQAVYSFGSGQCIRTDDKEITVVALPFVEAGTNIEICENANSIITNTHNPSGGYWQGIGIIDSLTGQFDPILSGAGIFSHTYSIKHSGTGCENQDTRIIEVLSPEPANAGNDIILCNVSVPHIMTGSPAGGSWSGNGISSMGEFTPSINGVFEVVYSFTDDNGCFTADTALITVVDPPVVNAGLDTSLCQSDTIVVLSGSPAGGTWFGTGISPDGRVQLNNVGTIQAIYSYGSGQCVLTDDKTIEIVPIPTLTLDPVAPVCNNETTFALQATPTGGTWVGNGILANGTFNPNQVTSGNQDFTYTYRDITTGCSNSETIIVTVLPVPIGDFELPEQACINQAEQPINRSIDGTVYHWDFGNGFTSTAFQPTLTFIDTGDFRVQLITSSSNGCSDTAYRWIELLAPPQVNFSLDTAVGCTDLEVTFSNTSNNEQGTWNWDFGDGSNSSQQHPPSRTYTAGGTGDKVYTIFLTATNLCGIDSKSEIVTISQSVPEPFFDVFPDTVCLNSPVQFSNLSNNAVTFRWDFGDGNQSVEQHPGIHSYDNLNADFRLYPVQLFASNGCGEEVFMRNVVTVPLQPAISFDHTPLSGCQPLVVTINNNSSMGAESFDWDFGDGGINNTSEPVYTYQAAGAFNLRLTASNRCGQSNFSIPVNVWALPTPTFNVSTDTACTGEEITVQNTSAGISSLQWFFSDGYTASSNVIQHIFPDSGQFLVKLIVTGQQHGCVDSTQQMVALLPQPKANVGASGVQQCNNDTVEFLNKSTNTNFMSWHFGDGMQSGVFSPTHLYSAGNYTVQAIAIHDLGCADTAYLPITVHQSPIAEFLLPTDTVCDESFAFLVNNQTQFANTYEWYINNILSSDQPNPNFSISGQGVYALKLVASNTFQCIDSTEQLIYLNQKPLADFEPINGLCLTDTAQFINRSQYANRFFWDFGNGFTSSDTNPSMYYDRPGDYPISLIAISNNRCADSLFLDYAFTVYDLPSPGFTLSDSVLLPEEGPLSIRCNASNYSTVRYYIDGIGVLDNCFGTVDLFGFENGGHQVVQILESWEGCYADTSLPFFIEAEPLIWVPNAFTPSELDGINDVFLPVTEYLNHYHLRIYDRWGRLVFESRDPTEPWNGRHLNQADWCKTDVYNWVIKGVDINDQHILKKGHVSLLR